MKKIIIMLIGCIWLYMYIRVKKKFFFWFSECVSLNLPTSYAKNFIN